MSGTAVSVVGDSRSEGATTTVGSGGSTAGDGSTTTGDGTLGGGTQVVLPVDTPVTIGGNAVSVVGDATTEGSTTTTGPGGGAPDANPGGEDPGTDPEAQDPGAGNQVGAVGISTLPTTVPAAALSSQLARTGTDAAALLPVALLLLAAGAALVLATRRRLPAAGVA